MLQLYICKICGEPHLAEEPPTDCQFCGAPREYLKPAEEYETLWGVELSEQEEQDIKATLDLEVNATAYYKDVAKANTKYEKWERMFKAFARVEKEHAEVAAKFLGVDLPEFVGEKSKGDIRADLERTKDLETHAMGQYKDFMERANSQKVKWFFHALMHAEDGHRERATEELK